jgi:hypothetical protein
MARNSHIPEPRLHVVWMDGLLHWHEFSDILVQQQNVIHTLLKSQGNLDCEGNNLVWSYITPL